MPRAGCHEFARPRHRTAALLLGLLLGLCIAWHDPGASLGQEPAGERTAPDYRKPRQHFRLDRAADLDGAEALATYERLLDDLTAGYALSGDPLATAYRRWPRYNRVPYRSAQHGERYVNNYANPRAGAYGRLEEGTEMPPGAVIVKDSFSVTAAGDAFPGPLFLMEKMPDGFNAGSEDWRYTMIMPDGSLFGTTAGEGSQRVEFCVSCHRSLAGENDHLFFVPERYRARTHRGEAGD